ncbi:YqaJ viral recombinase family protein [Nitrosomonas sp. Nm34]|uniref:YqaJ viral recombinase family nuclease n=1 Tax=Nitrosomonas sp. Nm34 TaxID=1881055 RepID=UPI0008EE9A90|nr:YqaJ viral recombinase family protein [Nitrosomonas sp. Nm34]SFI76465.1 putative phage-type endonuclease [Nitrosomonas sp. Nm34]
MNRQSFIGGSDAASILGISPWKSAYTLYLEKIGESQEEQDQHKERIFARGKRLEPVVVEMLTDELQSRGHEVKIVARNERYGDPEHEFLKSEIDLELLIDGEPVNGEIKTVHPFAAKDWGAEGSDEIPLYYISQVMHGLMIRPRQRAIVAALIGADDLRIHYVDRDQELIDIIREKELLFWNRVISRDPPPVTSFEDIKHLYKKDHGIVIDADGELVSLCSQLREHKNAIKAAEQMAEDLSGKIKLLMGDASVVMHEGRKLCTWITNKNSKSTDWKSLAMSFNPAPEVIEMYTNTKPGARPFLLK